MSDTLLLNADFLPLDVVTWQHAISLVYQGVAQVIHEYEDRTVSSAHDTWSVPAVIRLRDMVRFDAKIKFSRENVYVRDRFTCQYCGIRPHRKAELTFDHVLPRSRGGLTNFDNIVTCCVDCNRSKADQTPEEAGMKLQRKPARPSHLYYPMYKLSRLMKHPSWADYNIFGSFDEGMEE